MGNQFVALPAPAGNGAGAAVDVSSYGAIKTIIVQGSWALRPPTVNIEINNDSVPNGTWAPLCTFRGTGIQTVECAARWMRARVSAYVGGQAPDVNVGGSDAGSTFYALPVPAGNGVGAAVDVSAGGPVKTLQIGDRFAGSVILELSEDAAGVDWAQWSAAQAPGQATDVAAAYWARIKRVGVPSIDPYGVPICTLGTTILDTGGGGGSTTLFPATALLTGNFAATVLKVNQVDGAQAGAAVNATLPAASSVANGTWVTFVVSPTAETLTSFTIVPNGSDTIEFDASSLVFPLNEVTMAVQLISDGASNWIVTYLRLAGSAPTVSSVAQVPLQESGTTYVSPNGGDTISVTGSHFIGVQKVTIDGTSVLFTVVDDSTLTCVTPPGTTGNPTDIQVTSIYGSGHGANLFQYSHWRTISPAFTAPGHTEDDVAREFNYTLLLDNGLILLFGGTSPFGPDDKQCWLYNPTTYQYTQTGTLGFLRNFSAAAKLADGRVLVCGGTDVGATTSGEVYNPGTGLWTACGNAMSGARTAGPNAELLVSGLVLVSGGGLASSERYNPTTNLFGSGVAMPVVVSSANTIRIAGGDVLSISGVFGGPAFGHTYRYNAGANTWSTRLAMTTGRSGNDMRMALLPSGKVLVVGGTTDAGATPTNEVDIYDPVANTWAVANPIADAACNVELSVLSTGVVQRSGGFAGAPTSGTLYTTEQYTEGTGLWTLKDPRHSSNNPIDIPDPRITIRMTDNSIFVIGGDGGLGSGAGAIEQYRP